MSNLAIEILECDLVDFELDYAYYVKQLKKKEYKHDSPERRLEIKRLNSALWNIIDIEEALIVLGE